MNYKVVWTEEAEISLSEVIDYLDKKWYQKQVLTFLEKLYDYPQLHHKVNKTIGSSG